MKSYSDYCAVLWLGIIATKCLIHANFISSDTIDSHSKSDVCIIIFYLLAPQFLMSFSFFMSRFSLLIVFKRTNKNTAKR